MPYVVPNSTLQLFKNINLDNRYIHTIYFASESAQNTWFTNKVYKTFNGLSYQRYTRNAIKIECDAIELLGVTYMRFKNTRQFPNPDPQQTEPVTKGMWFYAFVNYIDYINEKTAIIYYEIDVMQTWFIQKGTIRPCMVLREHVNDDTWGKYLEPEPFGSEIYDRVQVATAEGFDALENSVVINSTAEPQSGSSYMNNGLFNGTRYAAVDVSVTPQNAVAEMYNMLGSWDKQEQSANIIDMFTFPTRYCNANTSGNQTDVKFERPTTMDLYTPKNNKLFTYPYSFLGVTTKNGNANQFKWEYFHYIEDVTDHKYKLEFDVYGTPLGGGMIICYPANYNGVYPDLDDAVVMSDFPKNAFAYDAYQAWIANGGRTKLENSSEIQDIRNRTKAVTAGMSVAKSALSTVVEGAKAVASGALLHDPLRATVHTGKAVDSAVQAGVTAANAYADIKEAQNKIAYQWNDAYYMPNIPVGQSMPCPSMSLGTLNFYFFHVHVREEEAKHIDDHFSMYGYAINRVKTPNLTGRDYWNFVQTQGAVINGDMPSSSKEAIARIFDGGITFWHNGDNIGNYQISVSNGSINNPITPPIPPTP